MANKKYALLVENEIFDILSVPDIPDDPTLSRWADGFLGNPVGMEITNLPNVAVGSVWNGENFNNSEVSQESINGINLSRKRYAMLNDNKIFMVLDPSDNYPKVQEMYAIAFSTNSVTGIDITNFPNEVTYEWTWNGQSFLPPESI
jgi:hypothetical protein